MLYYDYMDPQCMIGGHDLYLWCHQSVIWVWECLPRELVYMMFFWCLDACRFPIRCAFGSRHTHAAYKVHWLSLVPFSNFGGHFVICNFGHYDDVMMMLWWWKVKLFTKNTFLRKVTVVFFQKSHFWRMFAGYLYIHLRECLILIGYIKLGCEPLALYSLLGCEHVLKGEKDKNLEPSRRESSRRMSWLRMVVQVLAFQISWDHFLSK